MKFIKLEVADSFDNITLVFKYYSIEQNFEKYYNYYISWNVSKDYWFINHTNEIECTFFFHESFKGNVALKEIWIDSLVTLSSEIFASLYDEIVKH